MARMHHASSASSTQLPRMALILAVLALLLIGLVMVYSASSVNALSEGGSAMGGFVSQVVYAVLGIAAAFVVWQIIPYHAWVGRFVWVVWGVSMGLLVLTAIMGSTGYGAQRWLELGPVRFQPSEFVKIALVLVAVRVFFDIRGGTAEARMSVIRVLLFIVVPLFFLYQTQSDLGTTLICIVGILAVMWLGGVKPYILITVVVLGVAFMVFAVFGTGYRSGRLVYLDPWNDGQGGYGTGYNIIRSYYAFAEGGLFGVGLGNSHEKYQYLFASDSDFIFAVVGEELGLVGALTVIILFLVMLVAGLRISSMCPDAMGSVIAGAFTTMLVFQAFLNIGCTIGVFPTTGKPLPFISSGGSSMIASLAMVGFILSVSKGDDPATRRGNLRAVRVGAGPRP
ncbi:MAG: FtsW/RodA/SpoVE family cell cycle protein [Eggerthellaceae bacterium]|nr:FtsW/RodA/SpoVE family cell cycle protein [Eggerthellaceae bacterium]